MVAVIAIFKAGGVYLPIEPALPSGPHREDAGTGGVRVGADRTRQHDHPGQGLDTLTGVQQVYVDTAYAEEHAVDDLGVAVAADQLAYMKLAVALDRVVPLKDVIRQPVLADPVELIDSRPGEIKEPADDGTERSFALTCRHA